MKHKLRTLEKEHEDMPLTNMLAFVMMVAKFDKTSKYIGRVVCEALAGIDIYGRQKQLLTYLAIMKHFGDTGLPSSHCHYFIDELASSNIKNNMTLMETLCSQARLFTVERSTDMGYKILEISHEPVAYQLLFQLTKFSSERNRKELAKQAEGLILEEKILKRRFLKDQVQTSIRDLLSKQLNKMTTLT
jgi:hypothetical protein